MINTHKISSVANVYAGITFQRIKGDTSEKTISYPQVTLNSMTDHGIVEIDSNNLFHSKKKIDPSFITQAGDLLVRLRDPVIACYVDKDSIGAIVPSLFAIIRCRPRISPKYLLSYINSVLFRKEINKYISGTDIRMINISTLKSVTLPIPPLSDQEKIANLLDLQRKELTLIESLHHKKTQALQTLTTHLFT